MLLHLVPAQLLLVSAAGDRDARPAFSGDVSGGSGACPQCNPITRCLACRAQACEELLRYAVYNCMSIDTDTDEPAGLEVAVDSPELWRYFV